MNNRKDPLITSQKGFTLLEVLISIVVFILISMVTFDLFDSSTRYLKRGQNLVDRNEKARAAMNLMEQELLNAYAIVSASGSSITFRARTGILEDLEGHVDYPTIETVTYRLTGTKLERGMISQNESDPLSTPTSFETLISNVSSLNFTRSGKTIQVVLNVNTSHSGRGSMPYPTLSLSRTIFSRNLP